jgi:hypothetical protein
MRATLRSIVAIAVVAAIAIAGTAGAARLITGGQIQNGSIGLADLSKRAKRALKGAQGPPGPAGAQGASGVSGLHVVDGPEVTLCAYSGVFQSCQVSSSTAVCPAGEVATGGQGFTTGEYAGGVAGASGYAAIAGNSAPFEAIVQAQVYCARAGGAVAARQRTAGAPEVADRLAALRSAMGG